MVNGHEYLTCFYLLKSWFEMDSLSKSATNQKDFFAAKQFNFKADALMKRLKAEFNSQYNEINSRMEAQKKLVPDINEIWLITEFS